MAGGEILLLRKTKQMALYMRACDIFISKPGGLSSTEAAVAQVPYIQMRPIPGCETYNMRFFRKNGMSIGVKYPQWQLGHALSRLWNESAVQQMKKNQQEGIPANARARFCDWLESMLRA